MAKKANNRVILSPTMTDLFQRCRTTLAEEARVDEIGWPVQVRTTKDRICNVTGQLIKKGDQYIIIPVAGNTMLRVAILKDMAALETLLSEGSLCAFSSPQKRR